MDNIKSWNDILSSLTNRSREINALGLLKLFSLYISTKLKEFEKLLVAFISILNRCTTQRKLKVAPKLL